MVCEGGPRPEADAAEGPTSLGTTGPNAPADLRFVLDLCVAKSQSKPYKNFCEDLLLKLWGKQMSHETCLEIDDDDDDPG